MNNTMKKQSWLLVTNNDTKLDFLKNLKWNTNKFMNSIMDSRIIFKDTNKIAQLQYDKITKEMFILFEN